MRFLLFACVVGLLSRAGSFAATELANGVRAVVKDSVITERQVRMTALAAIEQARRVYRGNAAELQRVVAAASEDAVQQLVERQLVVQDFKASGFSLPERMIEDSIRDRIREDYGDRVTFIKTIQAEGKTLEKIRQETRERIMVGALQQKNVGSALIISPHKIETYYKQNADKYRHDDSVKLRMIVLDSRADATMEGRRKIAEEIHALARAGTNFADLARQHSTGSQRREGGDWGWVEQSVLREELRAAAFSLPTNQVSEVIETPDACYLLLVEDKRSADVRPLSEVRAEIERNLLIEERRRLQQRYVEKLKAKTYWRTF